MVKNDVIQLVESMDDNSSLSDIMYRLHILGKHYKAMDDIKNGRVYTTQEARRLITPSFRKARSYPENEYAKAPSLRA